MKRGILVTVQLQGSTVDPFLKVFFPHGHVDIHQATSALPSHDNTFLHKGTFLIEVSPAEEGRRLSLYVEDEFKDAITKEVFSGDLTKRHNVHDFAVRLKTAGKREALVQVSASTDDQMPSEASAAQAWDALRQRIDALGPDELMAFFPELLPKHLLRLATYPQLPDRVLSLMAQTGWWPLMARVAMNPNTTERTLYELGFTHPTFVVLNPALELLHLQNPSLRLAPAVAATLGRYGWETVDS